MIVSFLRHGIAEPRSSSGDPGRELTPEGREEIRRLSRAARLHPELILSSPYTRALQTAELLRAEICSNARVVPCSALVPHSSPERLWDEIRAHAANELLVVAHEPLLSTSLAWMLGSTRAMVEYPPGTLAALKFASVSAVPAGELVWMITPAMLP